MCNKDPRIDVLPLKAIFYVRFKEERPALGYIVIWSAAVVLGVHTDTTPGNSNALLSKIRKRNSSGLSFPNIAAGSARVSG